MLDVAASFRLQAGIAALLLCVARVSIRRWPAALLWLIAGSLCLTDTVTAERVGLSEGESQLRVMVQNVHTSNRAFNIVTETIKSVAPDVVAILETDDLWTGALREQLRDDLPHAEVKPRGDNFGISVFSARPMDARVFETPPLGLPSIEAVVQAGGGMVRIIATHPIPPLSERRTQLRDAHLAHIMARAAESTLPTVVMGDFNLAPTSPSWHRLMAGMSLRRVQPGLLPAGTWPSILGVAGVSIDHILISDGLIAVDADVLPSVGSDHRGVVVGLSRAP